MNPIPVPEAAKLTRPECQVVNMGKPQGVPDEECGSVEMLISPSQAMSGFGGRSQYAYFRPNERELEILNNGGFLELNQIGSVVQPFALSVWDELAP